ncbi:MAG: threonine--tRNA ligase, partial [Deltaproteobacteria bacterium]|nr:threonine--tRNA ligase [Deltaproteobacteria bacterium]
MRLLLIHADSFSFAVTEKTSVAKVAEKREEIKMSGRFKECLVAFVAVEKGDEKSLVNTAKETAQAISDNAEKLGTRNIVVYPYAHLSSELAAPRLADRGFYRVYEELKEKKGYKVKAAPFGYYKSFKISCKGHPLSELGKTITAAKKKGEKEEAHE